MEPQRAAEFATALEEGRTPAGGQVQPMPAGGVAPPGARGRASAFKENAGLRQALVATITASGAAYEEIGPSGSPRHFADTGRATTAKAIAELDHVKAEIDTLISGASVVP